MHDVIVVGIPLLAILAGILFNRSDNTNLRMEFRTDISSLRSDMQAGFRLIHSDLQQFDRMTSELKGRVDEISKRVS